MARVPIEEGYFRIPDDPEAPPVLLGSRCPNCGEVFFPRRLVCAQCLHEFRAHFEAVRGAFAWCVDRARHLVTVVRQGRLDRNALVRRDQALVTAHRALQFELPAGAFER